MVYALLAEGVLDAFFLFADALGGLVLLELVEVVLLVSCLSLCIGSGGGGVVAEDEGLALGCVCVGIVVHVGCAGVASKSKASCLSWVGWGGL